LDNNSGAAPFASRLNIPQASPASCGSTLTGLNETGSDRRLTKSPAGFQPMQAFDQNKPRAIGSHENGRLLPFSMMLSARAETLCARSIRPSVIRSMLGSQSVVVIRVILGGTDMTHLMHK
jgi:hypothetical protein